MKFRKSAIKELSLSTGVVISKKSEVIEKEGIVFVDGIPLFFIHDDKYVPTLHCLKDNKILPLVIIDDGAVKFLIKGADMMRPGIVSFERFSEGDFVGIRGLASEKVLGVGLALSDSVSAESKSSGKVLRTLHFVGDKIWNSVL